MRQLSSLLAVSLILGMPLRCHAMSVEEAYRAIPHERTVFTAQDAKMEKVEKDYLVRLFNWVDQGIVAKVSAQHGTPVDTAYKKVWQMESQLIAPSKLQTLQKVTSQAIHDEYAYLRGDQPRIQAASGEAHEAYNQLMSAYPAENAHNKQAFYDYYCALDFL